MEINYIKLGDRIRYYRTKAGLSQEKLAEIIDVSFQHMSNIETGKKGLYKQIFASGQWYYAFPDSKPLSDRRDQRKR